MDELTTKIIKMRREEGYSIKETAEILGVTKDRVKRVTSKAYEKVIANDKARKEAELEFEKLVIEYLPISNSLNNLCNHLGIRGVDGYYNKIRKIIKKHNLSTDHFGTIDLRAMNPNNRNKVTAMPNEEFFVENVKRHGESIIKRLISSGLKEYKCENPCCGINEWNGKPLRLQVHHVNGDHYDNRIENLQLLCPNCHTQTDTYGKGNKLVKNKNRFRLTERITEILEEKNSKFVKPTVDIIYLKDKPIRYCQVCGKETKTRRDKYCSPECAQKASMKFEVTPNQLIEDFRELKSYNAVGRKYGVSDNAIKKRTKRLGVYDEIRQFIIPR